MYYIFGIFGPSLLIESTDSMIIHIPFTQFCTIYVGLNILTGRWHAVMVCASQGTIIILCGIDPLQLHHKVGNFRIHASPYTDTPPAAYHFCTRLWPFILAAVGEHCFLSSCLLVTRSQNKQWPTIIVAWNYSTYYNFAGYQYYISCNGSILVSQATPPIRGEKGSGERAYSELFWWNSMIDDVTHLFIAPR